MIIGAFPPCYLVVVLLAAAMHVQAKGKGHQMHDRVAHQAGHGQAHHQAKSRRPQLVKEKGDNKKKTKNRKIEKAK
jgi:hypothetical protein